MYSNKHWEKSAIIKSIGNPTDTLLNAIADPQKAVVQEKRAMVVGYVQSGKTANYIGLINKALDAGSEGYRQACPQCRCWDCR